MKYDPVPLLLLYSVIEERFNVLPNTVSEKVRLSSPMLRSSENDSSVGGVSSGV